MVYTVHFSLQNAVCFIILTYLVPVFFTFYIFIQTNIGTEYFKTWYVLNIFLFKMQFVS